MPIPLISFCVAAATLLTSSPADTRSLAGYWRVEYLPNRAVRYYEVQSDGTASFAEFPKWKGRLTQEKGWTLRFEGDPDERKERLTPCEDGRLLVEHFNPTANVDSPDQIGVATRVKAGMLPGHAYRAPRWRSRRSSTTKRCAVRGRLSRSPPGNRRDWSGTRST